MNKLRIIKYKSVPSTQAIAKEKAKLNPRPWLVILAQEQTAGYGRKLGLKGDYWSSLKGGLYFSVILPKANLQDLQILDILAAFVLAKLIKENFSLEPLIKLPNDVLIGGKKIAGILTENVVGREVKYSVMGIGLNTNIDKFPKELENTATSLKIESGKEVDNEEILKQIIKGLKEQLKVIS